LVSISQCEASQAPVGGNARPRYWAGEASRDPAGGGRLPRLGERVQLEAAFGVEGRPLASAAVPGDDQFYAALTRRRAPFRSRRDWVSIGETPDENRICVITRRRILYGLAAMVALLVVGTISASSGRITSDLPGGTAVVTNIVGVVGVVLLSIALAVTTRRQRHN
jgi:hypothetical protein